MLCLQQWSCCAQSKAKAWAAECSLGSKWSENPHGNMHPDYGQNVGRKYRKMPPTPENRPSDADFLEIVNLWYNEKMFYVYDDDSCEKGQQCGHYKAVSNNEETL